MTGRRFQRAIVQTLIVAAGLAALTASLYSQDESPIRLVPDVPVNVQLKGSSTVNNWACAGNEIDVLFETRLTSGQFLPLVEGFLEGDKITDPDLPNQTEDDEEILQVFVQISPSLLDCGNARMERDLQKAVRADKHPLISYWFTGVEGEVRRLPGAQHNVFEMEVRGIMVLANQPREVVHTAQVRIIDLDELEVSGRLPLKMTDFDIEPPKALLGLIRAHDSFEVFYSFVIRPQFDTPLVP